MDQRTSQTLTTPPALLAHRRNIMATKMNVTAPQTAPKKDGVDKLIDYLVANRHLIGAIVLNTTPLAGKRMPQYEDPKQECAGIFGAADRVNSYSKEEKEAPAIGSPLTIGLATQLMQKLSRPSSFFG
jgi:hypothetical protein